MLLTVFIVFIVTIACVGSLRGWGRRPCSLVLYETAVAKQHPGLVGLYGTGIQSYPGKKMVHNDVLNSSWMLQQGNQIMTNNEYSGMLYLIDSSATTAAPFETYDLSDSGLAGAVHLLKHDNYVYVSCYGGPAPPTTGGYCRFAMQDQKLSLSGAPDAKVLPGSRIHFINTFKTGEPGQDTILIAVDLGKNCLWNINNFNNPTKISDTLFGDDHPRHFVDVGNKRNIVVITESNYPSSEPTPKLYLLTWSGREFVKTDVLKLGFNNRKIGHHTTGDEIQLDPRDPNSVFVTLRTYDKSFVPWSSPSNPGTPPTGGSFLKVSFEDDKLSITSNQLELDPNPRYFCILNQNGQYVAYICCQGNSDQLGSLIRVNIETMKELDDVTYQDGQPAFYLPSSTQ